MAIQVGVLVRDPLQLRLPRVVLAEEQKGKAYYNYAEQEF
jgi:hypothetical protein